MTNYVVLELATSPSQVVNVRTFGAVGDGSTDDTAAIGTAFGALGSGGVLYFPAGTYLTADLVFQSASHFTLRGDQGSVLYNTAATIASPGQATHDVCIIADCTDFAVAGLTFDGRRDTIAGDQYLTATAASGQANVVVQDGTTYVVGMAVGVYGGLTANGGTEKTQNEQHTITAIVGNVLTLSSTLGATYTATGGAGGAWVTQYQTGGIVSYTAAGRALGNEDAQNGLHLLSCTDFAIRDCVAQNVWESPIKLGTGFQTSTATDGCADGLIHGNYSRHGFDQGISVWNSERITVTANHCSDAGWAGISFTHSNDCTATGNICTNNVYSPPFDLNEGTGIAVEGGLRVVIAGNVCSANNSNGIRLGESPVFRGSGSTTTTSGLSPGDTSMPVADVDFFRAGSSHTLIHPTNLLIRETIYVTSRSVTSGAGTITLSRAVINAYATGATVRARYGEDNLITGNICAQNELSSGIKASQQIGLRIIGNESSENGLLNGVFTDTQGAYGIHIENHCEGGVIQNNIVRDNAKEGIFLDTACAEAVVQGNDVVGTGIWGTNNAHGIKALGPVDVSILGNKIIRCTGDAIALESGGGNSAQSTTIAHNTLMHNSWSGLRIDNGSWGMAILGNKIAHNGDCGMKLLGMRDSLLQSNQCYNQGGQEGIRFDDSGSDYCLDNRVYDNLLYDDQGSPTQSWGFRELGNSARTLLRGNRVYGNTNSAQVSLATSSRSAAEGATATPLPFLARTGWTASASASDGSAPPSNALDGNSSTRWATGIPQPDQWFQVDFGQVVVVSGISMDCGSYSGDYPVNYAVQTSYDNATWSPVIASGVGVSLTAVPLGAVSCRYIRITEINPGPGAWWSMVEFNAY